MEERNWMMKFELVLSEEGEDMREVELGRGDGGGGGRGRRRRGEGEK